MNRIAIIGAGRGGTELLKIFDRDPLVKVLKIADENPRAPGIKLARELGIPTTTDFRKLFKLKNLNTLIDVTGSPEIEGEIKRLHPRGVAVVGGLEAKFMWQLIEAQIRSRNELEDHLAEYRDLVRLYLRDARHAVSEERTRIAIDLHDGLVQTLVGLNYKMEILDHDAAPCAGRPQSRLREIREQLRKAVDEARYVVFNLKPLYFEKMELMPALRAFLKSYEKQTGVETGVKMTGDDARISPRAKVFLFRIIQESLSNVKRHARAARVHVDIHVKARDLVAVIRDDGVGFNIKRMMKDPRKWESFGVRGIEERAKLLGGSASIESLPGEGTTVRVALPLDDSEGAFLDMKSKGRARIKPRPKGRI
ncbi:MAG: hypothetical protein HZB22_06860 [Deltaproteobacteria bacterium]|nr:hypothetical protein [Deltaproteobacteria bacterium]